MTDATKTTADPGSLTVEVFDGNHWIVQAADVGARTARDLFRTHGAHITRAYWWTGETLEPATTEQIYREARERDEIEF